MLDVFTVNLAVQRRTLTQYVWLSCVEFCGSITSVD